MEEVDLYSPTTEGDDPEASPRILAWLARHPDLKVPRKVAANPNTPFALMRHLWIESPMAMAQNPYLELFQMHTGFPMGFGLVGKQFGTVYAWYARFDRENLKRLFPPETIQKQRARRNRYSFLT